MAMSARRKTLVIESCLDCHHHDSYSSRDPRRISGWCGKAGKEVHTRCVPRWCPLPDAPEDKPKKYKPEPETLLTDLTMQVRQHGVEPQ